MKRLSILIAAVAAALILPAMARADIANPCSTDNSGTWDASPAKIAKLLPLLSFFATAPLSGDPSAIQAYYDNLEAHSKAVDEVAFAFEKCAEGFSAPRDVNKRGEAEYLAAQWWQRNGYEEYVNGISEKIAGLGGADKSIEGKYYGSALTDMQNAQDDLTSATDKRAAKRLERDIQRAFDEARS